MVINDLSSRRYEYIEKYILSSDIDFVNVDIKVFNDKLLKALKDVDIVYYLATNPEVGVSLTEPRVHFNDNVLATFNVLEACGFSSK